MSYCAAGALTTSTASTFAASLVVGTDQRAYAGASESARGRLGVGQYTGVVGAPTDMWFEGAEVSKPAPSISVSENDAGGVVIALRGECHQVLSARLHASLVDVATNDPGRRVDLDLSEVTFVDSFALRSLLQGRQAVVARGGIVRVIRASPPVRRLLEVTGVEDLFDLASPDRVP